METFQSKTSLWSAEEWQVIARRLLALNDDQLGAVLLAEGGFSPKDIPQIIKDDIRVHGVTSGHIPILINEAADKKSMEKWLSLFESFNEI